MGQNMRNNFNAQQFSQNFVQQAPQPALYSNNMHPPSDADQGNQFTEHDDYGFDGSPFSWWFWLFLEFDNGEYEQALMMAEASTIGVVRKNAPANEEFQNVSPPDKKQRQNMYK